MLIKSKFSWLYLARPLFFLPLSIVIVPYSVITYFNEDFKLQERKVILIAGIFLFIIMIAMLLDIFERIRITLDEEKITSVNLITQKKEFFYYKDISKVTSILSKQRRIHSKGYFSRIYTMNDGRDLYLSPDVYENYGDLIFAISHKTPHLE